MPNKLVWTYEGTEEARHGEQCAVVGDAVHDDMLKAATAVRLEGAYIVIEVQEDGERVQKPRTKGHVYAMADGERGRKAHRAQAVPMYEYEKHRVL